MAYVEDIYDISNWCEHEYKFEGKTGKKGEKKSEKKKPTPEQMERVNQRNREKQTTRLIRANFTEGDYFLTIKYKRGEKVTPSRFKRDFKNFRECMRRLYLKAGEPFKYIFRMEIGRNGGAHIHLVTNKVDGITLADIQSKWKHGRINAQALYDEGGYEELAKYLRKKPEWTQNQQFTLFMEEGRRAWGYGTSKNLIRPQPKRKVFKRRTVEKMIRDGIAAKEGYRVMPESVEYGTNPFTGMSYLRYTEEKIKRADDSPPTIPEYAPPKVE